MTGRTVTIEIAVELLQVRQREKGIAGDQVRVTFHPSRLRIRPRTIFFLRGLQLNQNVLLPSLLALFGFKDRLTDHIQGFRHGVQIIIQTRRSHTWIHRD